MSQEFIVNYKEYIVKYKLNMINPDKILIDMYRTNLGEHPIHISILNDWLLNTGENLSIRGKSLYEIFELFERLEEPFLEFIKISAPGINEELTKSETAMDMI